MMNEEGTSVIGVREMVWDTRPCIEVDSVAYAVHKLEQKAQEQASLLSEIIATFNIEQNRTRIENAGEIGVDLLRVYDMWTKRYEDIKNSG